jgi:hypothetical protein
MADDDYGLTVASTGERTAIGRVTLDLYVVDGDLRGIIGNDERGYFFVFTKRAGQMNTPAQPNNTPNYGPQGPSTPNTPNVPNFGPQGPQVPNYGPQGPQYGPRAPQYGPQVPSTPNFAPQQPASDGLSGLWQGTATDQTTTGQLTYAVALQLRANGDGTIAATYAYAGEARLPNGMVVRFNETFSGGMQQGALVLSCHNFRLIDSRSGQVVGQLPMTMYLTVNGPAAVGFVGNDQIGYSEVSLTHAGYSGMNPGSNAGMTPAQNPGWPQQQPAPTYPQMPRQPGFNTNAGFNNGSMNRSY